MQIQPYFPEPIEVRGNVAGERYLVTLGFVRRTMFGHFLSVVLAVAVASVLGPVLPMGTSGLAFLGCLLALTLSRRFQDGGRGENVMSTLLLLPTLASLGLCLANLEEIGVPTWLLGLGYGLACLYGLLCGRDFSFVGQFVLTTVAFVLAVTGCVVGGVISLSDAVAWGAVTLVLVFYFVYDLAALLCRRRLGEEPGAVADLYRDLLNFLTYSVRVVLHWRRFRFI